MLVVFVILVLSTYFTKDESEKLLHRWREPLVRPPMPGAPILDHIAEIRFHPVILAIGLLIGCIPAIISREVAIIAVAVSVCSICVIGLYGIGLDLLRLIRTRIGG